MAETSIIALASRILSTIDSKSIKLAFERAAGSTSELEVINEAVEAVKPYLLDAEKREESSVEIKNWIKTVREALYDAEDMFEEVAARDSKAGKRGKHWKKVVLSSLIGSIPFTNAIAKRANNIKEHLDEASTKREQFDLERQDEEEPNRREDAQWHPIVEPKEGSIREEDRNAIIGFLLDESVSLVIIVGIRGIGKTTIAQLVCKNEEVQQRYETVWWASMSDAFDEKEIYRRILESIIGKSSRNLTLTLLKAKVRGCMFSVKSFLLVLDDLWAQDFDRFMRIRPLVKIIPKGSMIMVTSKRILDGSPLDGIAAETRRLHKLSVDDSKKLLAWFSDNEGVGEKALEACEHVPLAIKSLSSLYYRNRDSLTIERLSKINLSLDRQRAPLMFSYKHLNPDLKHCFAYCSLFPDNYIIQKRELVSLWVAQGYARAADDEGLQKEEEIGDSYFMQLLARSFFQEPKEDDLGEIFCCKMHDLVQDVAREVAGKESITLMKKEGPQEKGNQSRNVLLRHMAVGYEIDASWKFPSELFCKDRLRSILFMGGGGTLNPVVFDKILAKFKRLRALSLEKLNLNRVSRSIGELDRLKYLNLSHNKFKHLPDSITDLLNLLTLDISGCSELQVLPKSFSRLIKLRHLYNSECHSLRHMPPGIGKMTALQELGCFKVRKLVDDSECSRIDALRKLKLTKLMIRFDHDWKEDKAPLDSLPETLRVLHIEYYKGTMLPYLQSNLVELHLYNCTSVKDLSSLRRLVHLKNLVLFWMDDLEQLVTAGMGSDCPASSIVSLLSNLVKLVLRGLPKFKGWPRQNEDCFTRLSFLKVEECPELKYMPPSPTLKTLSLRAADASLIDELLLSSPSLEDVRVDDCDGLRCFQGEALTSLRHLTLFNCTSLMRVDLPPSSLNLVEKKFRNCPQLKDEDGPETVRSGPPPTTFGRSESEICNNE